MAQRYRIERDDKIDLKRTKSSFQMTLNWIKQNKYLVEKMMLKIFRLVSMILIWFKDFLERDVKPIIEENGKFILFL